MQQLVRHIAQDSNAQPSRLTVGVSVLVVKKPPLNSSASTTRTVGELRIVKSCGTVMATMGVEECELTFGLSGTAIHLDFGCSAGTAMLHMASWAIVPIILPLGQRCFKCTHFVQGYNSFSLSRRKSTDWRFPRSVLVAARRHPLNGELTPCSI